MSSTAKERVVQRMAREIVLYVAETFPPGHSSPEPILQQIDPASDALSNAMGAFERGEITYPELEQEGMRYVEAWEAVLAS